MYIITIKQTTECEMELYVGRSKQEKEIDNTLDEDTEAFRGRSVAKRYLLVEQHGVKSHPMTEIKE